MATSGAMSRKIKVFNFGDKLVKYKYMMTLQEELANLRKADWFGDTLMQLQVESLTLFPLNLSLPGSSL